MSQALIGHTGFVGGVLKRDGAYDALFNSTNIDEIAGRFFDRVVCAGVSAVKWKANADPEADIAGINRLKSALETVNTARFVLISTVDVYPRPVAVDEATPLDRAIGQAYGRHRLALEDWVLDHFPGALIVRLPALFGPGLKKNIIFDLMTNNQVDRINAASRFQWYDLEWLSGDLVQAETAQLDRVNFAVEPLGSAEIIRSLFPNANVSADPSTAQDYDVRTRYAEMFGARGSYLHSAQESLSGLERFVAERRP